MRGGLISRRYKTKAAERLHHSTECPPCVLTSLGLAAFQAPPGSNDRRRRLYKRTSAARCVVHATLACAWGTHSLSSINDVSCRPPHTLLRSFLPPFCAFVKCNMQLKAISGAAAATAAHIGRGNERCCRRHGLASVAAPRPHEHRCRRRVLLAPLLWWLPPEASFCHGV